MMTFARKYSGRTARFWQNFCSGGYPFSFGREVMGRFKIEKKCKKKKHFFSEKEALLFRKRSETGRGVSKLMK
jgi:hypothetical protein